MLALVCFLGEKEKEKTGLDWIGLDWKWGGRIDGNEKKRKQRDGLVDGGLRAGCLPRGAAGWRDELVVDLDRVSRNCDGNNEI